MLIWLSETPVKTDYADKGIGQALNRFAVEMRKRTGSVFMMFL